MAKEIKGKIVDIARQKIFSGVITIHDGIIQKIDQRPHGVDRYIMPGFIDAHVHIESSMLTPTEFAKIAVRHGTVATVSDPHEIANVLGVAGVDYMIENGNHTPFKFNFGAPSCVPATHHETAGAIIDSEAIGNLLARDEVKYLAEMMNYPGVLHEDQQVMEKIAWAKHFDKPVDGHAPGLRGDDITSYINAGMSTDHECFTYDEALEKLQKGMKVIIREGSAAKNFNALIDLLPEYHEQMMFCSDDKHPDDLLLGHIDQLCARAVARGIDVFKVLQAACINPIEHYDLDVGQLRVGDRADLIVVDNLNEFDVLETYIDGKLVSEKGETSLESVPIATPNNFHTTPKTKEDFSVALDATTIRVIEALDGELVTNPLLCKAKIESNHIVSDVENDILKITVVNRYDDQPPAVAFIKNFGLKEGAIASSVAHDSHNIIAVGVSDEMICKAVNLVIQHKGGVCAVSDTDEKILPLPIAGIMSDKTGEEVGEAYAKIDIMAKQLGSTLNAPFMTLSFMALLVIPSLKLSDKGLFDGNSFRFTSIDVDPTQ